MARPETSADTQVRRLTGVAWITAARRHTARHALCAQTVERDLQVIQPEHLPTKEMLRLVHGSDYLNAFLSGRLPGDAKRRIGLQEIVCSEVLIERTLWEVSGALQSRLCACMHVVSRQVAGHAYWQCMAARM